ncbi:MAG: ribonuclease E/G, partial [Planctomycetia bacterium]|nr:ribonuclease E/G [Planctomycetia bacterium]
MVIGRGFNDTEDGEYVGADERRDRRGSGGRGDRGDRGGRGRSDRGGRGDRGDRGGDRGDRGGDRRGGPRFGGPRREREFPRLPIEKIFKRGQEVIVQVIKEGIGTKVPTLSTKVSIAGRYLVLMPSLARVGVSRKIEDPEARRRLRDIMGQLQTPKGVGFIVRTAAIDRDAEELQNDLVYLLRLWQVVARRIRKMSAPVEAYRESDMITRTIRDMFTKDVDTIWVDDPTAFQHASEFLQIVMPKFANRIKLHEEIVPLFHKYKVEDEIAKINNKRIDLPRGGSIIIE